ncbi:cell surface glycoprotein CD200 receptor 1-A [Diretmus argenteus]
MMYTLWEISLKSEVCKIGSSDDGQSHNNCSTSKALHNTSSGESYLLIPNFSNSDEGVYKCESAYKGGSYSVNFQVFVKVRPTLSGSLEWRGSRWVAVCSAARGKPAASIVWRYTGNGSSVPTDSLTEKHQDGSYTVESQLALPEGVAPGNLTCAVDHPYWEEEQTSNTTPSESKSPPAEDVEEVEPYASYVQRVNSIYNSSVDLFT